MLTASLVGTALLTLSGALPTVTGRTGQDRPRQLDGHAESIGADRGPHMPFLRVTCIAFSPKRVPATA
jgi:hypothetical protein